MRISYVISSLVPMPYLSTQVLLTGSSNFMCYSPIPDFITQSTYNQEHQADFFPEDGEPEASKAMQSPSRHGAWRLPDRKRGADSARLSFHDNHAKTRRISPEENTF